MAAIYRRQESVYTSEWRFESFTDSKPKKKHFQYCTLLMFLNGGIIEIDI